MGGVCGVYSPKEDCILDLLSCTHRLQHLGQEWSGVSLFSNGEIDTWVRPGLVRDSFSLKRVAYTEDDNRIAKSTYEGRMGIGATNPSEKQPITVTSRFGIFSIAFDGRIVNFDELKKEFLANGETLSRRTEVELVAKLIAKGENIVEGIKLMSQKIKGSLSVVVLNNDIIYAARGSLGVNPLQIGELNGKLAVASETDAIWRAGVKFVRDVKPGEILKLSEKGFETVGQIESKHTAFCAFRWYYTGRVDAVLQGVCGDEVRKKVGAWHAEQDKKEGIKFDFIAGMPMSGTSYALGYSKASGVPFDEAFLYDRYSGRSYIPPTQEERDRTAEEKVSVMHQAVRGKVIGLTDDSIVRGTVLKRKIHSLKEAGAKEVHIRVGFPPLIDVCLLNVSTKKKEELAITKFGTLEEIRKSIGADSLRYTPVDVAVNFITEGTKMTKDDLCLYCINSESPLEK